MSSLRPHINISVTSISALGKGDFFSPEIFTFICFPDEQNRALIPSVSVQQGASGSSSCLAEAAEVELKTDMKGRKEVFLCHIIAFIIIFYFF